MEKRKKLRRLLVAALTVITTVLPPLLYSFLIRRGLDGVYMFGGDSFFWVGAVSVLGAAGIMIVLRGREEPRSEEPEESEDDSFEYFEDSPAVDTATAREEYPELFSKKEKGEDEPAISSSYHEALAAALNAQKAEYTEPAQDDKSEVGDAESFLYEKKEEDIPASLWDDLPDTLPEGYKAYEEETDLDESADESEDEDSVFEEQQLFGGIFKRVILTILLIAVPLGFSAFMSFFRTDYSAEGIALRSPLGNREYAWKDCVAYEIAPSFFGDRLSFTVVMDDGTEIELLPSDMLIVGDDFDDPYAYGVYVAEKLSYANAEKKVCERDTLESDLVLREDIGEYVKKLIE